MIVGDGPERRRIEATATPNVRFLGRLPEHERDRWLATARAFIFAAEEDFGIAPLEAQALGTPVIAYAGGASSETIVGHGQRDAHGHSVPRADLDGHRRGAARVRAHAFAHSSRSVPRERAPLRCGSVQARSARLCRRARSRRGADGVIAMNRSLLKQNPQLFEWAMRLLDPMLVVAVGVIAYSAYLGTVEHARSLRVRDRRHGVRHAAQFFRSWACTRPSAA